MPISLPPKARVKTSFARKQDSIESADWLGLWALSLGICAIVLAATAYFVNGDNAGAAWILAGAAVLIALIVCLGDDRDETSDKN